MIGLDHLSVITMEVRSIWWTNHNVLIFVLFVFDHCCSNTGSLVAMFFLYLGKTDLSSVPVYICVHWISHIIQGTRKTRLCLTSHPVFHCQLLLASGPFRRIFFGGNNIKLYGVEGKGQEEEEDISLFLPNDIKFRKKKGGGRGVWKITNHTSFGLILFYQWTDKIYFSRQNLS